MSLPPTLNLELLGATSAAALIVDAEGIVVTTNRSAEELFGWTQDQLCGKPLTDVCKLEQGPLHGEVAGACISARGESFPTTISKVAFGCDGTTFDLYTFRAPVKPDEGCIDKRFSDAILKLSRSPASADIDFYSAAARIVELVADVIEVDRVGLWLIRDGGKELECIAQYERSISALSSGTKIRFEQYPNYFRALEAGRSIAASDAKNDPRTREFAVGYLDVLGITSMLDSVIRVAGKVVGVVCHEQVGSPRTWRHDEITFAGEVADFAGLAYLAAKNREIESMRLELESELREVQKLEAIGRLAGGVAHDFNNLLSVILGHADFAMESELTPDLKAWIGEIQSAGRKAASLTSQLLSIGRQQFLVTEPVDINELIRSQLAAIRSMLPKPIELDFSEAAPEAIARADAAQIERILLNLCLNARDAIPNGGRITISTRVEIDETSETDWVVMGVADNGIGMSEQVRERVFEPFFTTKEAGSGTGLGLSTVYGIVHQHGGRIEVASHLGDGTAMDVYLPRTDALPRLRATEHESSGVASRGLQRGSGRLLVAEDSAPIRRFLHRLLVHAGYEVVFAVDGEEALSRFQENPVKFHMAILDVLMPKKSGVEVFHAIREIAPEFPILFTTGNDRDSIDRSIRTQKNVALLPKPWDSKSLLFAINEALTGK